MACNAVPATMCTRFFIDISVGFPLPGYVHGGAGELLQVYWEGCRHHAKEWPLELGEKEFGHFDGQFQTAADHDIAHQGLLSFIRVEGQGI